MPKNLLNLLLCLFLMGTVSSSFAAKPDKAIKHESKNLMKEQRKAMKTNDESHAKKEKKEHKTKMEEKEKGSGLAKQSEMKSESEMKEMDKGSEQGRTQREEVRKKWWKFWD